MAITDKGGRIVEYSMARLGIDLSVNVVQLGPEECLQSQNLFWRNGMIKRLGHVKFEDDKVSGDKKITGLYRFYFGSSKLLLASSGTVIKEHDGSTWVVIDATVGQSQTDGATTHMMTWGALSLVCIGNGSDTPIKYDGSTATLMNPTNLADDVIMFLPYQDRLLAIDNTNLGDLTWSASFSVTAAWETVASCGVRPDTKLFGMLIHSSTNEATGYESKVLLAGANGMYLFSGRNLITPFTTGDYRIESLAIKVGCNAPRTMVWTPYGSVWLGMDRQVYALPFDSLIPFPIGHKIRSTNDNIDGIEGIPTAQIENACATYHDGFYKLSFTRNRQIINTTQFWIDVDRAFRDKSTSHVGPWYGPMLGSSVSVFANQDGPGDNGELMAGEDNPTTGSFVYEANKKAARADVGTAIQVFFETRFDPLSSTEVLRADESFAFAKDVHNIEAEFLDTQDTVTIDFKDITGSLKIGDAFLINTAFLFWGTFTWGNQTWSNLIKVRRTIELTPAIQTRRLSIKIGNSSIRDRFELYALRVNLVEQNLIFA